MDTERVKDEIKRLFAEGGEEAPYKLGFDVAWAQVARGMGAPLPKADFVEAIEALSAEGFLNRRGRTTSALVVHRAQGELERDLMPGVEDWLRRVWLERQRPDRRDEIIDAFVEDVHAVHPPAGGVHQQPDFLAVLCIENKARFARTFRNDVYSFELKASHADDREAVREACEHRQHVHYANLIWHVDGVNTTRERADRIGEECKHRKLGFITFTEASDEACFTQELGPVRTDVAEERVEAFIDQRLSDAHRRRLLRDGQTDAG